MVRSSFPDGEPSLIIIGESPGHTEIQQGKPFVGKSGDYLRKTLRSMRVDDKTIAYVNAVACLPGRIDQDGYEEAAECCKVRLMHDLGHFPNVNRIVLGRKAQNALDIQVQFRWERPLEARKKELTYRLLNAQVLVEDLGPKFAKAVRDGAPEDVLMRMRAIRDGKLAVINHTLNQQEVNDRYTREFGDPYTIALPHPAGVLRNPTRTSYFIRGLKKAIRPPREFPEVVKAEVVQSTRQLPRPDDDVFINQKYVIIDLETDALDWHKSPILYVGIGVSNGSPNAVSNDPREHGVKSWAVPAGVVYTFEFIEWLKEFLEVNAFHLGGHNFKFDACFLHGQLGIPAPSFAWDTVLMSHVLDETWSHGLKELATYYFNAPDYEKDIKAFLPKKDQHYSDIPSDELVWYLSQDLHYNLMLAWSLETSLQQTKQFDRIYLTASIPVANELTQMEVQGVVVDVGKLHEEDKLLGDEKKALALKLEAETEGKITKPGSNPQCSAWVYDTLGAPKCKLYPLSERSTAADQLETIGPIHPSIATLLKYRRVAKLHSSYIKILLRELHEDDVIDGLMRVHPIWMQHSTVTGRLAARKPAIQTIPTTDDLEEGAYGKRVRDLFTVPEGYVIAAADGSQWELRVMACESGDQNMQQIFIDGLDFHGDVSRAGFGDDYTKKQRTYAKNFVFSLAYGGTLQSSARVIQVPGPVKEQFLATFISRFGRFVEWRDECLLEAQAKGFLETRMGRRFHFYLILADNIRKVRKFAVNYPVQGAAADLTTLAAARVGNELRANGARPIVTVHDDFAVEVPEDKWEWAAKLMSESLTDVATEYYPEIPWVAEVEVGTHWGSMRKV